MALHRRFQLVACIDPNEEKSERKLQQNFFSTEKRQLLARYLTLHDAKYALGRSTLKVALFTC